jgi:hypothetical protein
VTVNVKKLVKMGEDITANLAYTDDQVVVSVKVADHIHRFWDPRMIAAITDYAAQEDSELTGPLRLAINSLDPDARTE